MKRIIKQSLGIVLGTLIVTTPLQSAPTERDWAAVGQLCAIAAGATAIIGSIALLINWLNSESPEAFLHRMENAYKDIHSNHKDFIEQYNEYESDYARLNAFLVAWHANPYRCSDTIQDLRQAIATIKKMQSEITKQVLTVARKNHFVADELRQVNQQMIAFVNQCETMERFFGKYEPLFVIYAHLCIMKKSYQGPLAWHMPVSEEQDIAQVVRFNTSEHFPYLVYVNKLRTDKQNMQRSLNGLNSLTSGDKHTRTLIEEVQYDASELVEGLCVIEKCIVTSKGYGQEIAARETHEHEQERLRIERMHAQAAKDAAQAEREKLHVQWARLKEEKRANDIEQQKVLLEGAKLLKPNPPPQQINVIM